MSKSDKIKALLALKGLKNDDYRKALGLARPQALTNKYGRDSFTTDDLLTLCDLTDTKLAFIDENNTPLVVFDPKDSKTPV